MLVLGIFNFSPKILCILLIITEMIKGAHLMGAVGALAPTVFWPRPEIIYISVPFFLPPEVVYHMCTHAL